jgi:hypothetical protein
VGSKEGRNQQRKEGKQAGRRARGVRTLYKESTLCLLIRLKRREGDKEGNGREEGRARKEKEGEK